MLDLITIFADTHNVDRETGIINVLMVILLWTGGYLAAPMLFMATMGIFRNLAGMGSGAVKSLNSKMKAPGQRRRSWGKAAHEELKAQKKQNRGASIWGTRRRKMKEDYRESSRGLETKEALHADLTAINPTARQARARRGMSEKVLRQASSEQSQEGLSQARYQLEKGGGNTRGEQFHVFDENGEKMMYRYTDKNGDAQETELWKKDPMLTEMSKGAVVHNARSGAVVADGTEDSQRAGAMNMAQQGLIEPLRDAQAEADKLKGEAETAHASGDIAGYQEKAQKAAELQTILSEAVQSNVGSIMPKADDLVKGKDNAFGRFTADKMGTYDKTTLTELTKWLDTDANDTQIANFEHQADVYLSDPKRYGSQNAESLLALKQQIGQMDTTGSAAKASAINRILSPPSGANTIKDDGTVGPA